MSLCSGTGGSPSKERAPPPPTMAAEPAPGKAASEYQRLPNNSVTGAKQLYQLRALRLLALLANL